MSGLAHIYPRADRIGELVLAQQWDAVTYALEGWQASHGADRAYFRRLGLCEIAAWKRMVTPRTGMFRDHRCWRCNDGALPCVQGHPRQCEYPRARND
jgi:hypothetical protein